MVRYGSSTSSSSSSRPDTPDFRKSAKDQGADKELFAELDALHEDEFPGLRRRLRGSLGQWRKSKLRRVEMVVQYFEYIVETWFKCVWSLIFLPPTLPDWLAVVAMSFLACVIISVIFPWCLLSSFPLVELLANFILKKFFGGLSLVNFIYPWIFNLREDHAKAGREYLSKPPKETTPANSCEPPAREFNLDAAKILLQCAALVYERSTTMKRCAIEDDMQDAELVIKIDAWENIGLEYYPISECNSLETSFCALFWNPADSFIIVSFKGTSPTDFMEWRTNFSFYMTLANRWLKGFGRVHEGFMDKIFPKETQSRMPYDTIVLGIQAVSARLLQNLGNDAKINVWLTGHSQGCALASVAYSRMINESEELGPNIRVRDAYLFAAPILCDVISAGAFDNRMNQFSDVSNYQKTMWRVTNGRDAVATFLPVGGNNLRLTYSPWNLFAFSHLGSEIKMRRAPKKSIVAGNHITPGSKVTVVSSVDPSALNNNDEGRRELRVRRQLAFFQKLPIVGPIVAHSPGCYWASLMEMGTGTCEWEK